MQSLIRPYVLAFGLIAATATPALAQNAASLLYRPMPEDHAFEFSTDVWGQEEGKSKQSDRDTRLTSYQASGRFSLDPSDAQSPTAAIKWSMLDIHSSDAALPDDLMDLSIAGAITRPLDDNWSVQFTVGGGFAGDNAFTDGSAFYGLANIMATQKLTEESGFMFYLDYDGNRVFLPDVPLPGLVYYDRLNEEVTFAIGLPTRITWTPNSATTIRAAINPGGFNGSIEYQLNEQLTVFGKYDNSIHGYHVDADDSKRRLFFYQDRVEGGLIWTGGEGSFSGVEVTVAAGYAFDQEFRRGWDIRDDDNVRDITDEPYARIAVTARF